MASPRIQCLNLVRQVTKKPSNLRAAFSTSQIQCRDDPPQGDSATDLLGALTSFHSSSSSSPSRSSSRSVNLDQNPLNNVSAPRRPGESTLRVENLMRQSAARKAQQQQKAGTTTVQDLKNHNLKKDLTKQITRRWRAGDVYAPHDLSGVEMMKWKRRSQPDHDVFDIINFNPEEHYRNFSLISEYMTSMGKIKRSKDTGLRPVNQRRIARTIRRSIGMGMSPSVHFHPEILYRQRQRYEGNTVDRTFSVL